MKRFLIPVLFLFLSALNGGEDNFPTIRYKKGLRYDIVVHRFEDKGNTCYVSESYAYSGTYISISCVKGGQ